ncbi:MAG: energy transducer TonB family protein [Myxococcota bacterium]
MKDLENSKNTTRKFAVFGVLLSLLLHFAFLFLFSWFFFSEDDPDQDKDYQVVTLEKVEKSKADKKKKSADTDKITDKKSNPEEEMVKREDAKKEKKIKVKKQNIKKIKPKVKPTDSKPKSSQKKQKTEVKNLEKLKNNEVAVKPEKEDKKDKQSKGDKGKSKKDKQVTLPDSSETELKLSLSQQEVSKLLGKKARDKIKGVKSGKQTVLKTKRWVGASFFIRLKEAVSQVWSPGKVYRKHDPDGSFYGFKNWLTVLKISLTPKGKIKRIIITKPSGLTFLDKEAIRAFRGAAPFSNPPPQIVDPDTGLITFKFGFLVEVSKGIDIKMFRF